jgi:hypothetical protein
VATYAARSGQDTDKITAIMKVDRLMDATEAVELGLADETSAAVKMAASYSLRLLPQNAATKLRTVVQSSEPAPPLVKEGGDAGGSAEPPATTAEPTNVVELRAKAKTEGADEHARYVNEMLDLCNLSGMPQMARDLIATKRPIADARKELLDARARAEATPINPHRPAALGPAPAKQWDGIISKLNQRLGLAKK